MTKIEFCCEMFKYIRDGLTKMIFQTDKLTIGFNFNEGDIFIGQDSFMIANDNLKPIEIKYADVERILIQN